MYVKGPRDPSKLGQISAERQVEIDLGHWLPEFSLNAVGKITPRVDIMLIGTRGRVN